MILQHFMIDVGSQETNLYVMADEVSRVGLMVDAGGYDPFIPELVTELDLQMTHILLTHLHWDHVDALPRYLEHWPKAQVITPAPLDVPGNNLRLVQAGDKFAVGPFHFEVLKTSGHTPESVSYYCPSVDLCFVGDALFSGSVGGTSSDELYQEQINHIKEKILILPSHTEILPGHGPSTTVAIEREANPFLQPSFRRT